MAEFSVTPYEVEGSVDYDKLIARFGVERISDALRERLERLAGSSNFMIDRGIFFADRDLG